MTFVIVGGGPTGVELAGALGEIANDTLRQDFRRIEPSKAQIILVEGTDHVLPVYPHKLSQAAQTMLERLKVTVRTGAFVTDIQPRFVTIQEAGKKEQIPTRTVLWAAGVLASPLRRFWQKRPARLSIKRAASSWSRISRYLAILKFLSLATLQISAIETGQPLPGVAQPAIQQGSYVAKRITQRLRGETDSRPFHYFDKGNLATIGRFAAVADLNVVQLSGFPAWLIWIFVHLFYIMQFQNRLLV